MPRKNKNKNYNRWIQGKIEESIYRANKALREEQNKKEEKK